MYLCRRTQATRKSTSTQVVMPSDAVCSGPSSNPGPASRISCCAVKLPGSSALHVQPCVEGNVLGRKACCDCGARTRLLAHHWPFAVSDRRAVHSRQAHRIQEAWPLFLLSYKLFGHMQPSPWCDRAQSCWKVTQVDRQRSLTRRQFTSSEVPLQSAFFLRFPGSSARPTCQQRTRSSGTEATSLTSSGLWQTIPSPSPPLKTQVRRHSTCVIMRTNVVLVKLVLGQEAPL